MLIPGTSPAIALALGAAIALTLGNPRPALSTRGAPLLLKSCVVGLGFGMSFGVLAGAGLPAVLVTAAVVGGTFALGLWLGRALGVQSETSLLIACGTGICGGSAIAAVGSAIAARPQSLSVALATVFVLNAAALYLFPLTGTLLGMSETQFGTWAALAIHDTSSVVGAAALYGPTALATATVVKLTRALWIVPLTLGIAYTRKRALRDTGAAADGSWRAALGGMPWFVLLFILAVLVRTFAPVTLHPLLSGVATAARAGLVLTLFLIGAGLTRATLAQVGGRPFLQGAILWLAVASVTLLAITRIAA